MKKITQKALAESLKKQMLIKPLAKITVNDIVNECGLNRRTLYYYFQDIYDLLEWIYKTEIHDILGKNRTSKTWGKGFLEIFIYLQNNKPMVLNTFNSVERDILENHLYNESFTIIYEVVNELASDIDVNEKDKIYIANFYKIAFVGTIIEWIKNNMIEDPNIIINKLQKIITGDIHRALLKFRKNEEPN